jgi:hypothetical protein
MKNLVAPGVVGVLCLVLGTAFIGCGEDTIDTRDGALLLLDGGRDAAVAGQADGAGGYPDGGVADVARD